MKMFKAMTAACAAAGLMAGCSTPENLRLLRQPEMPSIAIAKASQVGPYYRNISIQEIYGAPEFRFFDGNNIINTLPTRKHILSILTEDLDNADMLAPNRQDSAYMLYVNVENLQGPDLDLLTDKRASARVTFRLVNWRTGAVARTKTEEASFVARYPGFTPETGRIAVAGALIEVGYALAINAEIRAGGLRPRLTDLETVLANGAFGFTIFGLSSAEHQPTGALKGGYFNGTARRQYATNEVIHLLMDEFLHDLSKDGSVVFKHAVSCQSLNPDRFSYPISETVDAVGVDCPGVHFRSDRLTEVGPSNFS